jgi:hypothetical protein
MWRPFFARVFIRNYQMDIADSDSVKGAQK